MDTTIRPITAKTVKSDHYALWVYLLSAIFYCYQYALRVLPALSTTYTIHHQPLSYYSIYVPMQLVVGFLVDYYCTQRLLVLACLICAIGSTLAVFFTHGFFSDLSRLLIVLGSAFAFISALKLASQWLSAARFATIAGITVMLGMSGGALTTLCSAASAHWLNWEKVNSTLSFGGYALAFIMFLTLHRGSNHHVGTQLPHKARLSFLLKILKNEQIWVNGLIGCLLFFPIAALTELWGRNYFMHVFRLDHITTCYAMATLFISWAISAPLMGYLSDKLKQRRMLLTIGAMVGTIFIAVFLYLPFLPSDLALTTLFLFGIFSSAQIIVFAISREIATPATIGIHLAVTNAIVMSGCIFLQHLMKILFDHYSNNHIPHGIIAYYLSNYQIAFTLLPLGLIVAALLSFFIEDQKRGQTPGSDPFFKKHFHQ